MLHPPVDHATAERVRDRLGLLGHLLAHEGRPAALLGGRRVPRDVEGLDLDGVAGEVGDGDAVGGDRDDLVLADGHGALRVLDEGGDIRAQEVLALAEADDERRVAAGADDDAGLVAVHREEGEGAVEPRHGGAEGLGELADAAVLAPEQHGGDLGVGLALEGVALGEELVLQLGEVLDDAVVDEGESSVVAEVRVRVAVGRAAVRRPAGVADAGAAAVQGRRLEVVGEHLELAGALRRLDDAVVVDDGDARRVVAAIFEATKASHEHVEAVALSDVSDDSTHALDCIWRSAGHPPRAPSLGGRPTLD